MANKIGSQFQRKLFSLLTIKKTKQKLNEYVHALFEFPTTTIHITGLWFISQGSPIFLWSHWLDFMSMPIIFFNGLNKKVYPELL